MAIDEACRRLLEQSSCVDSIASREEAAKVCTFAYLMYSGAVPSQKLDCFRDYLLKPAVHEHPNQSAEDGVERAIFHPLWDVSSHFSTPLCEHYRSEPDCVSPLTWTVCRNLLRRLGAWLRQRQLFDCSHHNASARMVSSITRSIAYMFSGMYGDIIDIVLSTDCRDHNKCYELRPLLPSSLRKCHLAMMSELDWKHHGRLGKKS